jgi:DNA polymerase-3 subunit alpha (Gram-positive type)
MESFIAFDIETTGISPVDNKITEIGAVKVVKGRVVDKYSQLINPQVSIPSNIVKLTGITDELVKEKPIIDSVLPEFIHFSEDYPILGHNIKFDFSFIKANALKLNLTYEKEAIDTLSIARVALKELPSRRLGCLCEYYNIEYLNGHRAFNDAYATYELYNLLKEQFYNELEELFTPKPILWKPKKQSPITYKQKSYLSALIKKHSVVLEKPVDELSKSEASRAIDNIIKTYGRAR